MNGIEKLLSEAVDQHAVRVDGRYTSPRTYGVYRIKSSSVCRQVRLGNHPVRGTELSREFGEIETVAIFFNREQAKTLADLLNGEESG